MSRLKLFVVGGNRIQTRRRQLLAYLISLKSWSSCVLLSLVAGPSFIRYNDRPLADIAVIHVTVSTRFPGGKRTTETGVQCKKAGRKRGNKHDDVIMQPVEESRILPCLMSCGFAARFPSPSMPAPRAVLVVNPLACVLNCWPRCLRRTHTPCVCSLATWNARPVESILDAAEFLNASTCMDVNVQRSRVNKESGCLFPKVSLSKSVSFHFMSRRERLLPCSSNSS